MNKILHEKPEAVDYVRAFFVKWKDRLETDQGSDFLPDERVGHQFSRAFLSLFLRYAHTNWPEKLSTDHYELAVRDSKFRSENYQEIKRQLNHEIRIRKPTRKVLMALLNTNGSAPPKGRLPVDGWHHLLAVAIHNVSVNYELNIGEEDFSNGRSAKAAVVIALSELFPSTDIDYQREQMPFDGTIPGRELLNKTWENWRITIRPAHSKKNDFPNYKTLNTEYDIFYAFYLSHFMKLIRKKIKQTPE